MTSLFGQGSSGPSPEQVEREAKEKRDQDRAAARAQLGRGSKRRGTISLTTSPTSTGLNIPGTGGG